LTQLQRAGPFSRNVHHQKRLLIIHQPHGRLVRLNAFPLIQRNLGQYPRKRGTDFLLRQSLPGHLQFNLLQFLPLFQPHNLQLRQYRFQLFTIQLLSRRTAHAPPIVRIHPQKWPCAGELPIPPPGRPIPEAHPLSPPGLPHETATGQSVPERSNSTTRPGTVPPSH
jgi:hypothetical protein